MNIAPARLTAFEILLRVVNEDAYASNLLAAPRYENLSSADHGLAHELTLGVLRWQLRLDFFIEYFTKRKINKLDAEVVISLRLALYQLLFLDRIPAHAAINDAVNLAKFHKKKSAAPMVNAVLRNVQRAGASELEKFIAAIKDPLEKLAVKSSHPRWLLQRWIERFGIEEAQQLANANNETPQMAFRFNRNVQPEAETRDWLQSQKIEFRASEICPDAVVVTNGKFSAQSEAIKNSWIYLQDEASQLVAHLLAQNPKTQTPNPKFLDLCAAPGSKTTLTASLLPENALIVAGDLYLHRLQTMRELASRAKITNLNLLQFDAAQNLPFAATTKFDFVLLDAPCSGLGTLQRHPEIKWRVNEEKIALLADLQKSLLANAAAQVAENGLLTYSVCSSEPEEGENVIAEFLSAHTDFQDITQAQFQSLPLNAALSFGAAHGLRTFAPHHRCESFFVCVLQKCG